MSESTNNSAVATEDTELRAGHPPALKVGNKRVSRSRGSSDSNSREDGEARDPAPVDPSTGAFVPHNAQKQLIAQNGQDMLLKESAHIAAESVKSFHEKPQPTREKPPNNVNTQKRMVIQQPK